jgi:tRNA-Thr(GGU) m(6)t(6)A37 methyltransferase TsaA
MNQRTFPLHPIGTVRSALTDRHTAPRQRDENAPEAWLELDPQYHDALLGLKPGDQLILLTWLHQSNRETLQVHPRRIPNAPLTGVFATRSPDRPNPIGLHEVTVLEIDGTRLRVDALECVDGTPILDLKPLLCP